MTSSVVEAPKTESPLAERRHITALDGARGAAVIAVLLFHGGVLKGGYLGVDLFFVLSGYLITSILLAETARTGTIGLGGFWARRARRLLPALFLMLVAVCAYAVFIAKPTELTQIRGDFLATLGYVANWHLVLAHYDYWRLFTSPSPLNHTWSLAIEEQFYVVWPLVALSVGFIVRRGRTAIAWARAMFFTSLILSITSAALALEIWHSSKGTVRIYYGTDTRAAAILFGAALASWIAWRGAASTKRGRLSLEILGFAATAILVWAYFRLEQGGLYSGGLLICSLAATAVIAAITHPDSGLLARGLSARLFVEAGIISYGLYLWHWPIYVWLNADRVGVSGWPLLAIRLAVTLAVALLSYRFVEKPIRYGAFSAKTLRWFTPCAAALLVGLAVISTRGAEASPIKQKTIEQESADALKKTIDHPGATRIMIVGNSVGWYLSDQGFTPLDNDFNMVTLNAALPGCHFPTVLKERGPELGDGSNAFDCTLAWPSTVAQFDPDIVVLLLGAIHVGGTRGDGWVRPCDALYKEWTSQALTDAQRVLTSRGAHLVISTNAYSPVFGFTPEVVPLTKCQNATFVRYAEQHPEVGLIDIAKRVCPKYDDCQTIERGVKLRPDFIHYQGAGALIITRWMIPQLGLPKNPQPPSGSTGTAKP
ncbi:putative acyltransferase [Actinobacteria bacterium IMCC26256]|nr:putative acyltransferase [Actinobacteria bacterium IMCC26256]